MTNFIKVTTDSEPMLIMSKSLVAAHLFEILDWVRQDFEGTGFKTNGLMAGVTESAMRDRLDQENKAQDASAIFIKDGVRYYKNKFNNDGTHTKVGGPGKGFRFSKKKKLLNDEINKDEPDEL